MSKEGLNFTRSGVVKIYEKMLKGEMTEEDFHEAAANTEALLRGRGVDIKVRYMGPYKPKPEEKKGQATLDVFKNPAEKL